MSDIQNYVNQNPDLVQQLINQTTKKEVNAVSPQSALKNDGIFESPIFDYKGRKAKRINVTTERVSLAPHTQLGSTIDFNETGELLAFTIDVNDPGMILYCIIYDEDGSPEPINDRSMHGTVVLGRGMSVLEAYETRPDHTSVDRSGTRHPYRPYMSRFKSTFTTLDLDYDTIKGTDDDKHMVMEYAPDFRELYNRIYFTVQNPTNNTRMITYLTISRIKFIDVYQKKSIPKATEEIVNISRRISKSGTIRPKIEI